MYIDAQTIWTSVGIFSTVVTIGLVYYIYDTKKENLRRSAGKFAVWLREDFGLELIAEFFECWSVGDKSGMAAVMVEMFRIVTDKERRREVLLAAFDRMVDKALADTERGPKLIAKVNAAQQPQDATPTLTP